MPLRRAELPVGRRPSTGLWEKYRADTFFEGRRKITHDPPLHLNSGLGPTRSSAPILEGYFAPNVNFSLTRHPRHRERDGRRSADPHLVTPVTPVTPVTQGVLDAFASGTNDAKVHPVWRRGRLSGRDEVPFLDDTRGRKRRLPHMSAGPRFKNPGLAVVSRTLTSPIQGLYRRSSIGVAWAVATNTKPDVRNAQFASCISHFAFRVAPSGSGLSS